MILKHRKKPTELLILEILNARMKLSNKDSQYYQSLKKGYEGEVMFDKLTESLQCDCLILNDLLLSVHNTTFQIDSLIITSDKVYIFEVKNFEGDYIYESDRLFTLKQTEIFNPLHQISRSKVSLNQLLLSHGFKEKIDAHVVFINPNFTLYQAPLKQPIIFPTQIKTFLDKMDNNSSSLTKRHKMVADKLLSLHIDESPFSQIPSYQFEDLQKGITCYQCKSLSVYLEGRYCYCNKCGHKELVSAAIKQQVEEVKLLFPNIKITTNIIYEWCKIIPSKKRISRVLASNYKKIGVHQWTYYV